MAHKVPAHKGPGYMFACTYMYMCRYIHAYNFYVVSLLHIFPEASHSRHVSFVTQQTCQPWATADMSAVSHSRHVCCVARQTRLLRDTADMSAVGQAFCLTQQACLLCHTAVMHAAWDTAERSAVSGSRQVCCVAQQIRLLCHTADMSAV